MCVHMSYCVRVVNGVACPSQIHFLLFLSCMVIWWVSWSPFFQTNKWNGFSESIWAVFVEAVSNTLQTHLHRNVFFGGQAVEQKLASGGARSEVTIQHATKNWCQPISTAQLFFPKHADLHKCAFFPGKIKNWTKNHPLLGKMTRFWQNWKT